MLDKHDIELVQSTIPLLEAAGDELTKQFYIRMFENNPEVKDLFNLSHQRTGGQPAALFAAVLGYAKHLHQPDVLARTIERIAHKHTSLHILPEHYPIVGSNLLATIKVLGGEQITDAVVNAWSRAYDQLANIFIQREADLYATNNQQDGGWSGARRFTLIEKTPESALVTSFVFAPVDEKPVMAFTPGQYIGVQCRPASSDYQEIRQYSLSCAPNQQTYRISVKREDAPAQVSNYLHQSLNVGDTIELHAPAGDFVINTRHTPNVLISAGVGLTPMQSALETFVLDDHSAPVLYLHACENPTQHSFKQRVETLAQTHDFIRYHTWYREAETTLDAHTSGGFMNLQQADLNLPLTEGNFYLCGPVGFMRVMKQQLVSLGVTDERIHYEVFGPHDAF